LSQAGNQIVPMRSRSGLRPSDGIVLILSLLVLVYNGAGAFSLEISSETGRPREANRRNPNAAIVTNLVLVQATALKIVSLDARRLNAFLFLEPGKLDIR
jgi:hypothetical protein